MNLGGSQHCHATLKVRAPYGWWFKHDEVMSIDDWGNILNYLMNTNDKKEQGEWRHQKKNKAVSFLHIFTIDT